MVLSTGILFLCAFEMESLEHGNFSSGSSDPDDLFLESHSLYRKHTLRDGSTLFRMVAEQLYDTQSLHYEVRQECVRYMIFKRRRFEKYIGQEDYDKYLQRMTKPRTLGTLIELRAMCFLYRRNVHFYEPQRLAQIVTFDKQFTDHFSVFYTCDKHFDSVFTREYYETAAIAQAMTYKLIYREVFRMPDLELAVQQILYPGSFKWSFEVRQENLLMLRNGRHFRLDQAKHTKCILRKPKHCSFHNRGCGTSCVRQLLNSCQLPISYKVAKSMDPLVYRNVDIDAWRDAFLEAKHLRVYTGDYYFRPGAKCRVELPDGEFYGYVQHIIRRERACIIFVEEIGKKLQVALSQVHPLPPDEFRPWTLSHRQQRRKQRYISHYKGTLQGEQLQQQLLADSTSYNARYIHWTNSSQFSKISYGQQVKDQLKMCPAQPNCRQQPMLPQKPNNLLIQVQQQESFLAAKLEQMWPQQQQQPICKGEMHKMQLQPWTRHQAPQQQMFFPQSQVKSILPQQHKTKEQVAQKMKMIGLLPRSSTPVPLNDGQYLK